MSFIGRFLKAVWNFGTGVFARVMAAVFSNRGLTLGFLLASVILIIGPWLRSSVARDFRGVHIPWNDSSGRFLPEYVVEAPRAWRLDSIAVPLLAIVAVGLVVTLVKPRWNCHVFGLLLAVSLPALAVTLWNHPGLFEFFESEIRGRSMLRTVFRHIDEDLMSVRAPDRLQAFGGQMEKTNLLAPTHPMLVPFQYWMYGPWLVTAAFVAAIAARRDTWPRRMAFASAWAAAGCVLAIAATWPRWMAEYHWAKADNYEAANQFAAADDELQLALDAMPDLAATRRYWITKGRLGFRQHQAGEHVSFFIAYQYLNSSQDLERARAEIEPYVSKNGGATAQRDLLGEIIGYVAINYISHGNPAASELAWTEAVEVAPWKPTYWVAEATTILATAPSRAPEVEEKFLPRLVGRGGTGDVGDCFVGADLASALGDAYFVTGDFTRARDMYTLAMDIFHLPKYVNLHAQEGKLGM